MWQKTERGGREGERERGEKDNERAMRYSNVDAPVYQYQLYPAHTRTHSDRWMYIELTAVAAQVLHTHRAENHRSWGGGGRGRGGEAKGQAFDMKAYQVTGRQSYTQEY